MKTYKIESTEQAIAYLENVLANWQAFTEAHKPFAQALQIILKEITK